MEISLLKNVLIQLNIAILQLALNAIPGNCSISNPKNAKPAMEQ